MINFLRETLKDMELIGKTIEDVEYVTITAEDYCGFNMPKDGYPYIIPVYQFFQGIDFNYDNGYGRNEIPLSLYIVFKDKSWLERHEYDGAESWSYKRVPPFTTNLLPSITKLLSEY